MACALVHPFNDPSADVVLVSSDDVAFKLHKIILSLASDFFKAMFSLSQPKPLAPDDPQVDNSEPTADAEIDGLPVIRVSEPGQVLSKLFRLCYPLDDPPLWTVNEVAAVLTAALKYELRKPIQMVSRKLRELMPTSSLRVYSIACRLDLEDEARAAAMVIRQKKLQDEYVAELEDISIGAYHRLLYYCETGDAPGGLFFTRRSTHRANSNEQPQSASVSHLPGSVPVPEPSALPAIVPVVRLPPPAVAEYPFNIPGPELTIETSDGTRFSLSRSFIELASPIFKAVDIILRVCSPVESPAVPDLPALDSALIAATKYKMKKAIQWLHAALVQNADAPSTDPLLLYAVACRHNMRDLALSAARRSLRTELTNMLHPELEAIDISAGYLYRLLTYRRRCRDVIRPMFAKDNWIVADWRTRLLACYTKSPYYKNDRGFPCWYSTYMAEIGREEWPSPDSAAKEDTLKAALTASYPLECSSCHRGADAALLFKFSEHVAATISRLENEVNLDWPSQGPTAAV